MLTNPTIEILKMLKLYGLLEALEEQQRTPTVQSLSFEERIALLIDRERLHRDNQRRTRLKVAEASIEDINCKAACGLDKRQIAQRLHALFTIAWIYCSRSPEYAADNLSVRPARAALDNKH